jgi:hypothetical protein
MQLTVPVNDQCFLPDAYGKYADEADKVGGSCVRSFPFEVEELPEGTRALAWIFMDWDSIPVCGFPWIHWCAQLSVAEGAASVEVPDDASRAGLAGLTQGYNSSAKLERDTPAGYVGPCPPNGDHIYTLRVVALDEPLDLTEPYWANELVNAAREHVLEEISIDLPSRC